MTGSVRRVPRPRARWRDVAAVHRLHGPLLAAYLAYAVWGELYGTDDTASRLSTTAIITVVANLLVIIAGLSLNTAADVHSDGADTGKARLVAATRRVGGAGRVVWWSVVEAVTALVMAVAVSVVSGRWPIAITVAVNLAAHGAYNLEPLRVKRRGWFGPLLFGTAIVGLPALASYFAVRSDVDTSTVTILVGASLAAAGRTAVLSVPDRDADELAGLGTAVVRSGVAGTVTLAGALIVTGVLLIVGSMWWRYGLAWAVVAVVAQAVYLAGMLGVRGPGGLSRTRRRAVPLTLVADATLVVIPLLAR